MENIIVRVAKEDDSKYSQEIVDEMASSAKARGTGIAKRTPEYVSGKMKEGKGVIALTEGGQWVGFCYIESWGHEKFVANSGLIVSPSFRGRGVAKAIKFTAFRLSRKKFPGAKIFGLTTGLQVMKINHELGYSPRSVQRAYRRRRVLEGLPELRQFPDSHSQKPQKLPLYRYALRPRVGNRDRSQRLEQTLREGKVWREKRDCRI